jgi:hypothetical protein
MSSRKAGYVCAKCRMPPDGASRSDRIFDERSVSLMVSGTFSPRFRHVQTHWIVDLAILGHGATLQTVLLSNLYGSIRVSLSPAYCLFVEPSICTVGTTGLANASHARHITDHRLGSIYDSSDVMLDASPLQGTHSLYVPEELWR